MSAGLRGGYAWNHENELRMDKRAHAPINGPATRRHEGWTLRLVLSHDTGATACGHDDCPGLEQDTDDSCSQPAWER